MARAEIIFGSRRSDLALTQSRLVARLLGEATGVETEIRTRDTRGDLILDKPLPAVGGKGLFTEELEAELRDGTIDAAVHSLKDLPTEDSDGLCLGAVLQREDPADVLIVRAASHDPARPLGLRENAKIGTSSPRRRDALRAMRSDLQFADIRGNVPTRLRRVVDGDFDATILAAAGLARLGLALDGVVAIPLTTRQMTCAPGQGALAVQCRADDPRVLELLATIHDPECAARVRAERDVLHGLGGGCSMPFGAHAGPGRDGHRLLASLYGSGGSFTFDGEGDLQSLTDRAIEELRPLVGESLAGQTVWIMAREDGVPEIRAGLQTAGATVTLIETTRVEPLDVPSLPGPAPDAIAFTSAVAVGHAIERFGPMLRELPIYAVGPATQRALHEADLDATVPNSGRGGDELGRRIAADLPSGSSVWFPCAENRHAALEDRLRDASIVCHAVPLYRTHPTAPVYPKGSEEPSATLFTSPTAVRAGSRAAPPGRLLAIGSTTADAMREAGLHVAGVADRPTAGAVAELILNRSRD